MSSAPDPFVDALLGLARARVEFVVVGVAGINFYARDPAGVVATGHLDLLLAPAVAALRGALAALAAAGFSFESAGEPFVDVDDERVLAGVVRAGANLVARSPRGAQVDLMLSIAGYRFEDLASDARRFRVGGVEVRVGRLEKLLHSKELSGRPKDVEFLRMYAARLRDEPG